MTQLTPDSSLIFTATYNEVENIGELLQQIWQNAPRSDILVVDDNSPDGTGRALDQIAASDSRLKVIHRPGKMGVGSAHRLAIKYAREKGYSCLVTMDADFSHEPKVIPKLIAGLSQNDFVIGSRFADGGTLDYKGFRLVISRGANFLARYALGVIPRETTTSFRAFNRTLLEGLPIDEVKAEGYSFFLECTYLISQVTKRILEVPIHFQDRRHGQSKISQTEIYRGFLTVARLFADRFMRLTRIKRPVQIISPHM